MGALLAVGQGSDRPSQVVVMQWKGAGPRSGEPIAIVGKGVTFDTGGISLKPAAGMGDMKWDMGGAGAVSGLMKALAGRKAKANVVGMLGLVENMPDGNAQRPGDIVTAMSGKTVEILNTDAEGRLVLADVLWYCQQRFKPAFMVDLATLTGAIITSLGHEYAGLFGNADALCKNLLAAGEATGEKLWRMPLAEAYDKMIDSDIADMKNIGGRDAGSITAAQFLQRFTNDVPWAHLDIAGTAMASPNSDINRSWGSGFGVRLLERLVSDKYES
jgi:leucyl aminopeptidase